MALENIVLWDADADANRKKKRSFHVRWPHDMVQEHENIAGTNAGPDQMKLERPNMLSE